MEDQNVNTAPEQENQEQTQFAAWQAQAETARERYPQLDLGAELQNDSFRALLAGGVEVQTAYEVLHRDALMASVMQEATRAAEQRLTSQMLLSGVRPAENGLSAASPAVSRPDVAKMTRQQRRDIIRRVQRGEKIRL